MDRIEREKEFHDKRFSDESHRKEKVSRFYKLAQGIKDDFMDRLIDLVPGKRVLELGCGAASLSPKIIEYKPAHVTGIDISTKAVEISNQIVGELNTNVPVQFLEMNAESLDFEDDSFDLVFGVGILHHLDLKTTSEEMKRVLKPGGTSIFIEPMGHNLFINLYRNATPTIRTDDEHPLKVGDFKLLKRYFPALSLNYYYVTVMGAALPGLGWTKPILNVFDSGILSLPFLRRYAWQVIMEMPVYAR